MDTAVHILTQLKTEKATLLVTTCAWLWESYKKDLLRMAGPKITEGMTVQEAILIGRIGVMVRHPICQSGSSNPTLISKF